MLSNSLRYFFLLLLLFFHGVHFYYSFSSFLSFYLPSLPDPLLLHFPSENSRCPSDIIWCNKDRHKPSYLGWTRQLSRRKRVPKAVKRARDSLFPLLGVPQEDQATQCNMYRGPWSVPCRLPGWQLISVSLYRPRLVDSVGFLVVSLWVKVTTTWGTVKEQEGWEPLPQGVTRVERGLGSNWRHLQWF